MSDDDKREDEFVSTVGPIRIDWPRTAGYYGALAAAVAFEVIAPPLALFIAAVPLVKLLKRRRATIGERFVAAVVEGAGKPVGGDAEGVVRPVYVDREKARKKRREAKIARATDSRVGRAHGAVRPVDDHKAAAE